MKPMRLHLLLLAPSLGLGGNIFGVLLKWQWCLILTLWSNVSSAVAAGKSNLEKHKNKWNVKNTKNTMEKHENELRKIKTNSEDGQDYQNGLGILCRFFMINIFYYECVVATTWGFITWFCFVHCLKAKAQCTDIHSKSEKVCGPAFSVKKIAEKVRKSGRHFWAIWG